MVEQLGGRFLSDQAYQQNNSKDTFTFYGKKDIFGQNRGLKMAGGKSKYTGQRARGLLC